MRVLPILLLGCDAAVPPGLPDDTSTPTEIDADTDVDADTDADADTDVDADSDADTDTDPSCAQGRSCNPIPITTFPFVDTRDTSAPAESVVDSYGCDPTIDESGGEFWYVFTLVEEGQLVASIDEIPGDGVDVDVHLLDGPSPQDCVDRDHERVAVQLGPGTYRLALDTWGGPDQAGPYTLTVTFSPGSVDCSFAPQDVRMFWTSCAVADCYSSGQDVFLATPTLGPVVKEAHLVTTGDAFGGGWPTSGTDQLAAHYALSEAATGYVANRTEPWAPSGEGGSVWGQGSTGGPIPVEDEGWYITMYWRDRPAGGTRMLVKNPANGRVVVASAGWETGPGSNARVAGVVEEVHDWLGSVHLSELEIGFANDQSLPLGPLACP